MASREIVTRVNLVQYNESHINISAMINKATRGLRPEIEEILSRPKNDNQRRQDEEARGPRNIIEQAENLCKYKKLNRELRTVVVGGFELC